MNDTINIDALKDYAVQFRKAIIATNVSCLPVTLRDFPRGACGDSSWLLGRYLRENGIYGVEHVCGLKSLLRNEGYMQQSHAWLEVSGVIIDITSDQFDGVNEAVVVTADNSWHKQFEEERRMIADYNAYESPVNIFLDKAYMAICKNLTK